MIKEFGFSVTEMFVEILDPNETIQRALFLPSWGMLEFWQNECSIQYLSNGKAVAEGTLSVVEEASTWLVMIRYVFSVGVTIITIEIQVPLAHLLESVMLEENAKCLVANASKPYQIDTLQWRHNGHSGVSSHQPHTCLLDRLFRRRSKKTSKLRVTGLCEGNSPVTGDFPAPRTSNAENVSIWWRHHEHGNIRLFFVIFMAVVNPIIREDRDSTRDQLLQFSLKWWNVYAHHFNSPKTVRQKTRQIWGIW